MIKATRIRWTGHVARMGEGRVAFKFFEDKPTGKRPWHRWVENTRMNLKEMGISTTIIIRLMRLGIVIIGESLRTQY
jgi:hypothetical protein